MSATRAAVALLALSVVFMAILDVSLYFTSLGLAPVALALVIPALALGNGLGWLIVRDGPGRIPAWVVVASAIHLFGGALFDMVATIIHTPDLAWEANAIARSLLDSGVPLSVVYVYAVVAQLGLQTLSLLGVCGWLTGRPAFAAGTMKVDRYSLALRLLIAWPPIDLFWSLLRWYLGFEWFSAGSLPMIRDQHVLPLAIPLGILLDLAFARRWTPTFKA